MKALIIQGGGFRTAFSSGVLDAFMDVNFNPFEIYAGVSGGANALSYYLSNQKGGCIESIRVLYEDSKPQVRRLLTSGTILNVDFFYDIANEIVPWDKEYVRSNHSAKKVGIVMTNRSTGKPHYFQPTPDNWIEACIASCTLPFITKGKHIIDENEYMDGSWSDPLPVNWAIENGATEIVILRTAPTHLKEKQSIPDKLGELYYKNHPGLRQIFANNHKNYNTTIDLIESNGLKANIVQIAPKKVLDTSSVFRLKQSIESDYLLGIEFGKEFLKDRIF